MPLTLKPCPALATEPFVTVVYGYPGVGKSPVAAALPDVTYYDLQLGTRYTTVNGERVVVESVEQLEAEIAARR